MHRRLLKMVEILSSSQNKKQDNFQQSWNTPAILGKSSALYELHIRGKAACHEVGKKPARS